MPVADVEVEATASARLAKVKLSDVARKSNSYAAGEDVERGRFQACKHADSAPMLVVVQRP